jgi:hypothetical protein
MGSSRANPQYTHVVRHSFDRYSGAYMCMVRPNRARVSVRDA